MTAHTHSEVPSVKQAMRRLSLHRRAGGQQSQPWITFGDRPKSQSDSQGDNFTVARAPESDSVVNMCDGTDDSSRTTTRQQKAVQAAMISYATAQLYD